MRQNINITANVFDTFKHWAIDNKAPPSLALRKVISQFKNQNLNSSIIIRLIEQAYPEIDISRNNFTFKIHDSGYPYTEDVLNDNGFDELVEEMKALPPGW